MSADSRTDAHDVEPVGSTAGAQSELGKDTAHRLLQATTAPGQTVLDLDGDSTVEVGDLLSTSPTPGHAMKARDASEAFGAVLGKAMAPLARGCGLVPILIALQ